MYCRNCGSEMNQNAVVCVKCGVSTGTGNAYCPHCGKETAPVAVVCLSCGCSLTNTKAVEGAKSKLIAGLLGIFLGGLGIHDFYLGNTKKGIIHIILATAGALVFIGPVISGIGGLVDGIFILTGKISVDANGTTLQD